MPKIAALFCILLLLLSISQPALAQLDPGFNLQALDDIT